MTQSPPQPEAVATLREALLRCKQSFITAGIVSFFINILILVPMIYMMQVYDRVMASSSVSTLGMLTLLLIFLLAVMGALEWVRSQILVVTSNRLDQLLNTRVFDAMFTTALPSAGRAATAQPLGDLLQLRQFLTGNGLGALQALLHVGVLHHVEQAPGLPLELHLPTPDKHWTGASPRRGLQHVDRNATSVPPPTLCRPPKVCRSLVV